MTPTSDAPPAIGRYRIEGLLGRGAMGVVYRAYDPEIERPVAVKLVRADLLVGQSREEYRQRFRREAQAAGRCSHPNIVGLYDVSADESGNPFLVMEYVPGTSVDRLLAGGQAFSPGQVITVGVQVLEALDCAHGLGVVHRDIKPANILLLEQAQAGLRVKVTDFGISHIVASDMTQVGTVIGTPSYMSPEQCLGQEVGPQSDLFSMASVLYEMLSGQKAFHGTSIGQLTLRLMQEKPSPIPGLPPRMQAVLDRAHAKRTEDRFASAGAMAEALRQVTGTAKAREPAPSAETVVIASAPFRTGGTAPVEPGVARDVERLLAAHVGPLARHLFQRALEQAESADAFVQSLAESIEGQAQREAFLRRARAALRGSASAFSATGQTQASGRMASAAIPAEDRERVARELARHVGPVASLLVRRAASSVASVEQLRAVLATHIDDEKARRAFLAGR
ncbi:MAG: protein kinase [Acetobacteraceae bacterium]|nr:protein kinase [Acetobacteraceae bacterium]